MIFFFCPLKKKNIESKISILEKKKLLKVNFGKIGKNIESRIWEIIYMKLVIFKSFCDYIWFLIWLDFLSAISFGRESHS